MEECPICNEMLEQAEEEVNFEGDSGSILTVMVGAMWCPSCNYYEIRDAA